MTDKIRSSYVMANGVKTHFSECGDSGPAVVLIHGAGPGASGKAGFRFMLPALGQHFRAYAIDQLSFGLTDARPHAWPVNGLRSLLRHISDFIDALCLDEVYLVGNSQGAYLSVRYALDNPERVKKMFLIGSATISSAMGIKAAPLAEIHRQIATYDGTEPSMRKFLESIILNKAAVTDELVSERNQHANRPGISESRKAFNEGHNRMMSDPRFQQWFDLRGRMPEMVTPAHFIWGVDDVMAPVSLGHELQKLLPKISFDFIEGAGHQAQTDRPDLVNKMVIDYFRS